jgi:hypothetical protein
MSRLLLLLFPLAALVVAQPAPPVAPAESVPPSQFMVVESTRTVPLFRPRVVMRQEIMLPKDPFLAGALSLVMPGTGQAYCGKWFKGLGFLAGTILSYGFAGAVGNDSTRLQPGARAAGAGMLALVGLTVHGWSVLDAVRTADVNNRTLLETP